MPGFATLTVVADSSAVVDSAPRRNVEKSARLKWFGRASIGQGWVLRSDQENALRLQGYDSPFTSYFGLDGAYFPWPRLGLGVWGVFSERDDSTDLLPEFEETVLVGGVQVPVAIIDDPHVRILLDARLGVVTGRQQLHGAGEFVEAPAVGLDFGVVFPKAYFGLGAGMFSAPVSPTGELGADGNFGRGYFVLVAYIDG